MTILKDDGVRLRNYTEVLSWNEYPESRIGSLGAVDNPVPKRLRCSVNARRSDEITQHSGTNEPAKFVVNYYSLITWTRNTGSLKKDQECQLSKIGNVRVVSFQIYGDYGIQTEIIVEAVS